MNDCRACRTDKWHKKKCLKALNMVWLQQQRKAMRPEKKGGMRKLMKQRTDGKAIHGLSRAWSDNRQRHQRRFERYCTDCGWGFTPRQCQTYTFCPKCGLHLQGAKPCSRQHQHEEHQTPGPKHQRPAPMRPEPEWQCQAQTPVEPVEKLHLDRIFTQSSPLSACQSATGHVMHKAQQAVAFAHEHPFQAAGVLAAGSAGAIVTGGLLKGAGQLCVGFGTFLTVIGALNVVASGHSRYGKLGTGGLGMKGVGWGLTFIAAGAVMDAVGTVAMVGGAVGVAGSAGLAGYGLYKGSNRHLATIPNNQLLSDTGKKET